MRPIERKWITHALIVLEVSGDLVIVYDPDQGERALPRDLFIEAWRWQHNLAIIVER